METKEFRDMTHAEQDALFAKMKEARDNNPKVIALRKKMETEALPYDADSETRGTMQGCIFNPENSGIEPGDEDLHGVMRGDGTFIPDK